MDIKGVIEFFKARGGLGFDLSKEFGLVDKDIIIEALENGEKYKQIVKDIENDFDTLYCNIMSRNGFDIIKEKHFPKPKTEIWERFINVDFPNSESVIVKMVATKKQDGNIFISYEPQYNYSEKLEKGGEI